MITEKMIEAYYKAHDASLEMQPREGHQAVYDGLSAALSSQDQEPAQVRETLYRWRGPRGGWIYDERKPSWPSEKLELRALFVQGEETGTPSPVDHVELRKRIMRAIFDPGATEGFKGDRDLTTWQTDAVMRALASSEGRE